MEKGKEKHVQFNYTEIT